MFCFPVALGVIRAANLVMKSIVKCKLGKNTGRKLGSVVRNECFWYTMSAKIDLMCCITEAEVV